MDDHFREARLSPRLFGSAAATTKFGNESSMTSTYDPKIMALLCINF